MTEDRYTVLVVDDDQEIIDLLSDHFKKRNGETIATADPATVVDKLRNFSVKLVLLDLKMKMIDGFEVLDKIKKAGLGLPPTIIITGYLPKYQERLLAYGIDLQDVVTKPFNFEVMEAAINRKLGREIITSEVGSEYESKIYANNRCRVGFVEDEEDILHDVASFFEERNYKVSCFNSAFKALDILKTSPVDILFVDIKLPGMKGDELMRELSKLPRPPYMIPISSDPITGDMRKKLEQIGCRDFVEKPFDVVELIERVKKLAIKKCLLG